MIAAFPGRGIADAALEVDIIWPHAHQLRRAKTGPMQDEESWFRLSSGDLLKHGQDMLSKALFK